MIVQEALRNDNFLDAAAFVRQSEAYLRVLRPAGTGFECVISQQMCRKSPSCPDL